MIAPPYKPSPEKIQKIERITENAFKIPNFQLFELQHKKYLSQQIVLRKKEYEEDPTNMAALFYYLRVRGDKRI